MSGPGIGGLNLNPRSRWLSKRGFPRPLSGLLEAERLHLSESLHPVPNETGGPGGCSLTMGAKAL